ncbi:MAG: hypothetical protein V1495_01250 [Pseudomonadota bacterium]
MKLPRYSWLLLLAAAACSRPTDLAGRPVSPYHDIELRMTKEARFIGLEKVRYLTSAVFKSRALREGYVEEYARRYELPPTEREKLRKRELEEADKFDVFLVSHFATDKDTGKLTQEAKVWRLALVADGNEAEAIEPDYVGALDSTDTVLRYFYPQITAWSKVFLVKFKRRGDPARLELRMAGVVDTVSFDWNLGKGS